MGKNFTLTKVINMKKWKIIKIVTIAVLALFIVSQVYDAFQCMQLQYPQLALGIETHSWIEKYFFDLAFTMIWAGIPLLVDIVLLIISLVKTRQQGIQKIRSFDSISA